MVLSWVFTSWTIYNCGQVDEHRIPCHKCIVLKDINKFIHIFAIPMEYLDTYIWFTQTLRQ